MLLYCHNTVVVVVDGVKDVVIAGSPEPVLDTKSSVVMHQARSMMQDLRSQGLIRLATDFQH